MTVGPNTADHPHYHVIVHKDEAWELEALIKYCKVSGAVTIDGKYCVLFEGTGNPNPCHYSERGLVAAAAIINRAS